MANINGSNNAERLNGTASADTIRGYGGGDIIRGMGGDDLILGGDGGDLLDGGGGYDTIFYYDSTVGVGVNLATGHGTGGTAQGDGYVSIESVWGSSYNDTITGRDDADEMFYGLNGNDVLKGGGGSDMLDGGLDDDILKGGGGADQLIGGAGIDTADYSMASAQSNGLGVVVDLSRNFANLGDATGDTFVSIENLTGSAYIDSLIGDAGANALKGLDGDDLLGGLAGDDYLDGGDGNDSLHGGTGIDRMTGGAGDDWFQVDNPNDVVIDGAGQGANDEVSTTVSYALSTTAEIELLYVDNWAGTERVDLRGNDFNQRLDGNEGVNVLNGLGGNDTLRGFGGNDELHGGAGMDTLIGGDGNDAFAFRPGEANGDTVVDFVGNGAGAGDVLVFIGYGPGATFTQVDSTHWQVNYNGGASHDVITFLNGGALGVHPSDLIFG